MGTTGTLRVFSSDGSPVSRVVSSWFCDCWSLGKAPGLDSSKVGGFKQTLMWQAHLTSHPQGGESSVCVRAIWNLLLWRMLGESCSWRTQQNKAQGQVLGDGTHGACSNLGAFPGPQAPWTVAFSPLLSSGPWRELPHSLTPF